MKNGKKYYSEEIPETDNDKEKLDIKKSELFEIPSVDKEEDQLIDACLLFPVVNQNDSKFKIVQNRSKYNKYGL